MSSEIDPNKIAAQVLQDVVKDAARTLTGGAREIVARTLAAFHKDLTQYLTATLDRCSHVKTPIVNRDRRTYLFDVYVNTKIRVREKNLSDDDFIPMIMGLRSVVIAGNAGSGKSMLMRYIFVALCEQGYGKVPLFIELRNLNSFAVKKLTTFIYYSIIGTSASITEEQFLAGLKSGAFTVILDGFDEVDFDQRKTIEAQILELREQYPDIVIIVSSRPDPDNRFQSWNKFHVCRVCPMDKRQVTELIRKIDYDTSTKRKFMKALREGAFDSHKSFLSSPLLCLMMLVTFDQTAQIPAKMHIFYEQAFDALSFLHDSAKEGVYKRKTYANLPSDEFRNCLSAFCITSYAKEQFSFRLGELRETISQALKIEKKSIEIDDFVSDLIESTCLIQLEGAEYSFTHRSFQEYFAAYFIARSPALNLPTLLDQFSRRREDDVVKMAFAMNRHLLEREWLLPKLNEFLAIADASFSKEKLVDYISMQFGDVNLYVRSTVLGFVYGELRPAAHVWFAIIDLYPNLFAKLEEWESRAVRADQSKLLKLFDELVSTSSGKGLKFRGGDQNSRVVPISILLKSGDNERLAKTHLPEYFQRQIKIMRELKKKIEEDVSQQKKILEALFP